MQFSIFRICGNSLPPRHSPENNIKSVRYILQHEPHFENSTRTWVLNKIADAKEREQILSLLKSNGERYIDLPFDARRHFDTFLDSSGLPLSDKARVLNDDFQVHPLVQEWVIRHKSQYLVGINEARNHALSVGRQISTWTLVLDGGVVFSRSGWENFVEAIASAPTARFALIGMRRVYDWDEADRFLLEEQESALGGPVEEPQIAFHSDTEELFDERLRYGHRNKAELISRIGVPGPWTDWKPAPWENLTTLPAPNKGRFIQAGWVVRLPTDGVGTEIDKERFVNRFQGVVNRSLDLDLQFALSKRQPDLEFRIGFPAHDDLKETHDLAAFSADLLSAKDRFITDKASPAPSGSFNDYHSAAPYWTAHGTREDGVLQYQKSDDDDPLSGRFDRASLMQFTSRVYGLSVSGRVLGRRHLLAKASELLRLWFLNATTRLNPTARYAQLIPGKENVLNEAGIIELRQLSLLPYAVRILADDGLISADELAQTRTWFRSFLRDCESTGMLGRALKKDNNIGTWSSVLFCSAALFSGEFGNSFYLARNATIRLGKQLGPLSIQYMECERTRPLHYSLFNLSAWLAMVSLGKEFSIQIDQFRGARGESIREAIGFCGDNRERFSDYSTDQRAFDEWIELLVKMLGRGHRVREVAIVKSPDLGIPPVVLL
ncbi:alginate lyase family protein [Aestuariivirga sp.]|uniref:alginate lyase family protein n=1 Tax=Aestuariivirga sp. TaxID=2650926 RepID=UPI00391B7C39